MIFQSFFVPVLNFARAVERWRLPFYVTLMRVFVQLEVELKIRTKLVAPACR